MTRSTDELVRLIETYLDDTPPPAPDAHAAALVEASRYPLLAGGKRLRPLLVLATVEALGGDARSALPTAAALEWIHTFSLVHDDLPALDDDAQRRGQPSTHIVYGDDVAILVGDVLLTGAFRLVAERQRGPAERRLAALTALAQGCDAMIHGQYLDLRPPVQPDEAWLTRMCRLKTGGLIQAAVAAGLALVAADDATHGAYNEFAEELGLGFQIVDDIPDQDAGSDDHDGGSSDQRAGRRTWVSLLGADAARARAEASNAHCQRLVRALPGDTTTLAAISHRVYQRAA